MLLTVLSPKRLLTLPSLEIPLTVPLKMPLTVPLEIPLTVPLEIPLTVPLEIPLTVPSLKMLLTEKCIEYGK